MSYKALYRKYRSQNFDELVGQEAIVKTLLNALKKAKFLTHTYLVDHVEQERLLLQDFLQKL